MSRSLPSETAISPDVFAALTPDRPAIRCEPSGTVVSFGELVDRSRRFARALYDLGLRAGDHIAVLMGNHAEFLEVCWAARRSGLYYTPINWHLAANEAAYILNDCQAKVLIADAQLIELAAAISDDSPSLLARVAQGIERDGWLGYDHLLESSQPELPAPELEGEAMFYSSGTTGMPKGILHPTSGKAFGDIEGDFVLVNRHGIGVDTMALNPAPLYHAGPLVTCMQVNRYGGTIIVMERFDAEDTLRVIEQHKVDLSQTFVATMFVRLLKLPAEVRAKYDVSSLRRVNHSAAPCPVPIKQQMMDWWGPILHESYSATEAIGMIAIGPVEWLSHPGSVGRPEPGSIAITDEDGDDCPPGVPGVVWFTKPLSFAYHGDADKTASSFNERGWANTGDMGYLDDEGYLYLSGRVSHMIISGGVNIYPQETEDILITHPLIDDVAVIGIPDEEYGQSVHAVVQLDPTTEQSPQLADDIIAWCRDRLSHYKCPRTVSFATRLPRTGAGKLLKRVLEEEFAARGA